MKSKQWFYNQKYFLGIRILTCHLLFVSDVYHVVEVADGDVTQDEQESGQDDLQVNILRILSKMFLSDKIRIGQKNYN